MHTTSWPTPATARLCLLGCLLPGLSLALTVTNTADSGPGSLRQAILDANSSESATINFDIPDTDPGYDSGTCTWVLRPASDLPQITANGTVVDGSTQTANQGDRNSYGPEVVLDGTGRSNGNGLWFTGCSNGVVRSLVLRGYSAGWGGWGYGVAFEGGSGHVLEGCYLGTDATGTVAMGNLGGVYLSGASSRIGGTSAAQRNVISGNAGGGVAVTGPGATGNLVQGNYLGVDRTGQAALGNSGGGVLVSAGAMDTQLGGTAAGAGNLISGNPAGGVWVTDRTANHTTGSVIEGNLIGTDATGTRALPNVRYGVAVFGPGTRVGGPSAGQRNVICATVADGGSYPGHGVYVSCDLGTPTGAVVQGNYLGVDATGRAKLGNAGAGVYVGTDGILVGGSAAGAGNLIGGNGGDGVYAVSGEKYRTTVQGNWIGTDPGGTVDLGNVGSGVHAYSAVQVVVGGLGAGEGNVIARNGADGVRVATPANQLCWAAVRGNSVYQNGGLGIDLRTDTGVHAGVTMNDAGDNDTGANELLNYPVLTEAVVISRELHLKGYAHPGAAIDLCLADRDRTGFGEGKVYLLTRTEGATDDRDGTTGTYEGLVNGLNQGTDTTNRFEFVIPQPAGVVAGVSLTATATLNGNTSEFGGCVQVAGPSSAYLQQPASTVAGQALAPPVQVELRDHTGQRLSGATMRVVMVLRGGAAGAQLLGRATIDTTNGLASFDDLSVRQAGTGYQLVATVEGLPDLLSNAFEITPAAPAKLQFEQQPSAAAIRRPLTPAPTVRVLDAFGNRVPTATMPVTVALGANPGGATLAGTATRNAVAGLATFDDLSLDKAGAGYTLTASATGLDNATSTAFDVTAAVPVKLAFGVQPSETVAGQPITPAVTVRVLDAQGNLVDQVSHMIGLSLSEDAAGAVLQGTTSVAAVSGVATFNDLSLTKAAAGCTLTATATGLTSASSTPFSVRAAALDPAQSTLVADPTHLVANGSEASVLTVTACDAYGNPRAGLAADQVVLALVTPPAANAGLVLSQPTAASDASGRSSGTLRASRPRSAVVRATVEGVLLPTTVTVHFTPRPVSAERSKVVLTPARVAADGQEQAKLKVTLCDAGGVPVEGSLPEARELAWDGPTGGLTTVTVGEATGPDGCFEALVTAGQAGSYGVTAKVGEVALSKVSLSALSYVKVDFPAGLKFVSLPLEPEGERLTSLLQRDDLQMARYDAPNRVYQTITAPADGRALDPAAAGIVPASGLWVRSGSAFSLNLLGEPTKVEPFTVRLVDGWNAIGNPYVAELAWSMDKIRVLVAGTEVGSLADTGLWQTTVLPYGWVWRPTPVPHYALLFDPTRPGFGQTLGVLEQCDGLWVRALVKNVSLVLPAPSAARVSRSPRQVTPRDWAVSLLAASDSGQGSSLFGISSTLTRALPIADPPSLEAAGPVQVKLTEAQPDERLAGLLRPPATGEQSWEAEVTSADGHAVTLTWPSLLRQAPRGLVVSLKDQQAATTCLLNTRSSYRYTPTRAGEARRFRLSARFGHFERSEITAFSVAPTRGRTATWSLTLSGPATVTVTIRGLGGGVVNQFGTAVTTAGTTGLSWTGLDQNGRKVPAGTYVIEAVAVTANGAQSRAIRTAVLP